MNWEKLKTEYPNAYPEIKKFSDESKITDGYELMSKFLDSKGFYSKITWIRALKNYEQNLNKK